MRFPHAEKACAKHKWHAGGKGSRGIRGGSRVGARMGRRGILLAEMSTTFAVVDQLPAFNKLALRDPFKANHV